MRLAQIKEAVTVFCRLIPAELCEVLESNESPSEAQILENVKYQCLDCLAMFYSPEMWLEHRKSHSRSSTHSNTEVTVRSQFLSAVTPNKRAVLKYLQ